MHMPPTAPYVADAWQIAHDQQSRSVSTWQLPSALDHMLVIREITSNRREVSPCRMQYAASLVSLKFSEEEEEECYAADRSARACTVNEASD